MPVVKSEAVFTSWPCLALVRAPRSASLSARSLESMPQCAGTHAMVTGMGKFRTISLSFLARAEWVRERQPLVMIPSENWLSVKR